MRRVLGLPWLLAGLILVLAPLVVGAVYRLAPPAWTVDIGGPLSGPLIPDGSFYGDEAEAGGQYRSRWSRAEGTVMLPDIGDYGPVVVRFRASSPRPAGAAPAVVSVLVDSRPSGIYTLTDQAAVYTTPPISRFPEETDLWITFRTTPFHPAGDNRDLGLKLETVRVEPAPGVPGPWPPLAPLLAVTFATLGVYAGLLRLRRPWLALAGAGLILAAVAAGLAQYRPLLTPWLPALGLGLGVLGGLVFAAPALGRAAHRALLPLRWPDQVAYPHRLSTLLVPLALGGLLLGYAAYAGDIIPQVDWIGHADYAENAVVARNLAAGRGPVVDYVAQFYRAHPGITHPAETWPLFQPLITVPAFLLFGAQTWAAKLPNLLLLLLLTLAVYRFAARWWDRRVGLLAAACTLLHPYFFQTVLLPINDLAFTLTSLLTLGWAWETVVASRGSGVGGRGSDGLRIADRGLRNSDTQENTQHATRNTQQIEANSEPTPSDPRPPTPDPRFTPLLAGLAAGLLIWSKGPSGAVVLAGLVAGLILGQATARWAGRRPPWNWSPTRRAVAVFAVTVAPLLIYNMLTFHAPFYSTESLDVWLLRLSPSASGPLWEKIYGNYLNGTPLPGPALLLHSYSDLYTAVGASWRAVWTDGVVKGEILGKAALLGADVTLARTLGLLLLGAAGWVLAPRRLRGLALAWGGAFAAYGGFVLLAWHYESRYALALVPWIYLGAAAALIRAFDGLTGDGAPWRRAVAWGALALALAAVGVPDGQNIGQLTEDYARTDNFAAAGRWAAANLPPDAVVMTRNPWEFNWYAQRKAVMIPEGSLADIQAIITRYHVTYIWLGGPADSLSAPVPVRRALAPLYHRQSLPGLPATLLYDQNYLIYRLDTR